MMPQSFLDEKIQYAQHFLSQNPELRAEHAKDHYLHTRGEQILTHCDRARNCLGSLWIQVSELEQVIATNATHVEWNER